MFNRSRTPFSLITTAQRSPRVHKIEVAFTYHAMLPEFLLSDGQVHPRSNDLLSRSSGRRKWCWWASTCPNPFVLKFKKISGPYSRKIQRKIKPTNNDDVELETTLEQLVLNLLRDRVETDIGCCTNFLSDYGGHFWILKVIRWGRWERQRRQSEEDGMDKGERGNVEKWTTRRREKTTTKIRAREKPKKGLAAFGRKLWLRRNLTLSSFSISTATGDDRDVTSPCILGMSWFLIGSAYIRKAIHATQDVGML